MKHQPAWIGLLALAVFHYTLVPLAYADTAPRSPSSTRSTRSLSADEAQRFATREAANPGAGEFVGGQQDTSSDFDPVVFTLVLTGVIVFVVLIVALAAAADAGHKTQAAPPTPMASWTCPSCGGSYPQAGTCGQCGMGLIRK